MNKFCIFALLVVLCAVCEAVKKTDRLQVGVQYRPETCERKTKSGDSIKVHYTGKLMDGTVFDSSVERGQPFSFKLGQGMVIKGWDQGLLGACVGEKRKLVIPPNMGYGDRATGKIPANSVLIFTTEIMGIEDKSDF
eukprot:TRINITY_DN395_c0_g1_i1.p1 TRINITY_DN395_c0_g1~~TRINITY_DN395_c0_g1_i1.p1  ORF type:complete len:137 (-),score=44.11 TRINITY_DN395_c0_g1_i1:40-450(-)